MSLLCFVDVLRYRPYSYCTQCTYTCTLFDFELLAEICRLLCESAEKAINGKGLEKSWRVKNAMFMEF